MSENHPKVFGIGLSRTATKSLAKALRILGYESIHFPWLLKLQDGEIRPDFEPIRRYDAFTDTPVARFYRELDEHLPGSKFILTLRDLDQWLDSCERYFYPGRLQPGSKALGILPYKAVERLHMDLYGGIEFDRDRFSLAYRRHVANVEDHFHERKESILKLNICVGEGWGPLCRFLDKPVPARPFPFLHRADLGPCGEPVR